jgi:hypothetical protein
MIPLSSALRAQILAANVMEIRSFAAVTKSIRSFRAVTKSSAWLLAPKKVALSR